VLTQALSLMQMDAYLVGHGEFVSNVHVFKEAFFTVRLDIHADGTDGM
jgi:hypothetical protein